MKKIIIITGVFVFNIFYFQGALAGLATSTPTKIDAIVAKPTPNTKISLLADDDKLTVGELVKIRVWLKSLDLVNVVSGNIVFDPNVFALQKIDKTKTVANLWLFEPDKKNSTSSLRFGSAMIYPGFES